MAVDDIVDVTVILNYPGPREKTNMVIADVGVPTGFEVVQASLDKLIEDGTVSRVEVAIRKVIFYIDQLTQGAEFSFMFQVKALFPIKSAPVSSTAYDYYMPEDKAIDAGTGMTIGKATFIRGDSNRDKKIDISDVITSLLYMFSGGEVTCTDAVDANDDGLLNIADPIYTLLYIFRAGSPKPPEPFDEPGEDPTPDQLDCKS